MPLWSESQEATIFFSVDMSYQITLGNFDPSTEFVDLAGTFNGWGTNLTSLVFCPGYPNDYSPTIALRAVDLRLNMTLNIIQ